MKNNVLFAIALFLLQAGLPSGSLAQDSLLSVLDSAGTAEYDKVIATFKASRIINGQSIEGSGAGELQLVISHRFGQVDNGVQTFFGLDDANTMLSLEYGISDKLQVALQRSSFNKMVDGFLKYRFLDQTRDDRMPFSAALFLEATVNTTATSDEAVVRRDFKHRWAYVTQVLLARKFGEAFSLQLSPTLLHRNLVPLNEDPVDLPALGAGARYKLSERMSLNLEYFYRFREDAAGSHNPFAIGLDIETGGHVFQLHFTNARQMTERGFLTETSGDFFKGNIHFGFNISRVFQLGGGKSSR
ncbi:hypothetical protein EDD80_101404 [Anseongella ginsenosidimutans]|uniref:DUF5777 domain-containing protein n=1 Tax=Anseongella ginsenosidimutans TaxID=496056 RepID=A0A4R3KX17_9SPHI|nr:DUF5777 family beta-barrel protein [Anseongella ginsenosidimutans]QEC51128.1 hypothetical protein FRZ59_01350 [Anseongella ginsenosidimutans]TCS90205.1 hypothetical protein EDD80_101404 [Anseongella ginsenosidimutans]